MRGQFVAEGSELDQQLKTELKGAEISKTDLKRESEQLQKLGESLMGLRSDLFQALNLPDKLVEALADCRRITNFEGRRRQMQFIGKLMRQLDEPTRQAAREALDTQRQGSARETQALHEAETWRDALIEREEALGEWLDQHPDTDAQQLRALVRQARKDKQSGGHDPAAASKGLAPRQGRAYREIFQLVREQLQAGSTQEEPAQDEENEE